MVFLRPKMEQVRKVIDTAWGMFRRFGVRSVSMDDVAREMSISKKTLYRCFRDKNELITLTLDEDLRHIEKEVDSIIANEDNAIRQVLKIANFVSGYFKQVNPCMIYDLKKYHPELYREFTIHREKTFIERVEKNLKTGVDQGFYRSDLDIHVCARLYLCLMNYGPEHIGEINQSSDLTKIFQNIMSYHLHSIATPKGLKEAKDFINE